MLVKDWMTEHVITIGADDCLLKAAKLMDDFEVSLLPVTDGGKLIGIISDGDLKRAGPSDAVGLDSDLVTDHMSRVKVGAVMTRNPVTVPEDYTVDEVAKVMLDNKISGCPVRDREGRITGIVTKSDLFRAIIAVTGLDKKGLQIGAVIEDRPGSLREVTDIIRSHGGRLVSILTSYHKAPKGCRYAYIRAFNVGKDKRSQLKRELHEKLHLIYLVDHTENKRELFNSA
jgi:acetoin utilization protein AcuB